METHKSLIYQYIYISLVVASYWIISISMVFVNKRLLSSDIIHLDTPFFITAFQCIVSIVIIILRDQLIHFFPIFFNVSSKKSTILNKETFKQIFLLSVVFTTMIASNNLCLKYVGVAFYYIGRSLTTVFNVIFTYVILGEQLSSATITCCGLIVIGFILGVDQEKISGSLSISGVIFGLLGSLSVSLFSIGTKKVLPHVNQDIWRLTYYNNLYSIIMFLPLMLLNGEFQTLYNYDKLWDVDFWIAMVVAGFFGFAIGYVSNLQIKVTSSLTHNISGTAKSCVQTVIATNWYNEHKTFLWWLSNFVVLGSSAAYARVKQLQMKKEINI